MAEEKTSFGFATNYKGVEKIAAGAVKTESLDVRPSIFWDAWHAAEKIPENRRRYHKRVDFAEANGKEARERLSGMFPREAKDIMNLNAGQAIKAYCDIREVYFR